MIEGVTVISDVLSKEISYWKEKLESNTSSNDIVEKLLKAIDVFDEFRQKYAEFFLANIKTIDLPADSFIFRIEQTLLEYWEPIKRAVSHYIQYPELITTGFDQLEHYKNKLEITRDIPAVLYFDKVPRALRIPFGPILFIGIPLTDGYRGDWKAIPHELGHQVFWNSQFVVNNSSVFPYQQKFDRSSVTEPKERIFEDIIEKSIDHAEWPSEQKEEIKSTLGQWTEEIFAEVIGTKIAGATFVESAWEKILNYINKPTDAFYNDGKHPKPYLVPFIRQCVHNETIDIDSYKVEVKKRLGEHNEISDPDIKLMISTIKFVKSLFTITDTLQPIVSVELDPFEQLRKEFPDNSLVEKLLKPLILQGTLTWTCQGGFVNDVSQTTCSEGTHSRPFFYSLFPSG